MGRFLFLGLVLVGLSACTFFDKDFQVRRLTEGGWEIALSLDAVNLIREVNERKDALENAVTRRAIQLCLPAVPNKGKPELRKRPAYADTEKVWKITCGD